MRIFLKENPHAFLYYAVLLQVNDKAARDWYEREAVEQTWSVCILQCNISSQYYYRMLQTQKQELVETWQTAVNHAIYIHSSMKYNDLIEECIESYQQYNMQKECI